MDTRPTLDRVRETVFDILQFHLADKTVLDLYAGSGAMALEAVSRGAAGAVLVDRDREAVRVIRRNVDALGFGDACTLLPCDDRNAISRLARDGADFDIVFLDPPYRMDTNPVISEILEHGLLRPQGILCVEYGELEPLPVEDLKVWKERVFGQTRLRFFRRGEG